MRTQRIVLASQSPRRRQLLEQIGLRDFTVTAPNVDETVDGGLSPEDRVIEIAKRKVLAAREASEDQSAVFIAADTLVFLGDAVLGKPADEAGAAAMLRLLSGKTHQVCTGIAVAFGERVLTGVETADVSFRALSEEEIRGYIATGEPMDKAGAYGIQGRAALFVREIRGDYYTVVGLPVCRLGSMLSCLGVKFFPVEDRP